MLDSLLELLVLVNNLNAMFVLLFSRMISNFCKMTIDRHYRWSRRMSAVVRRAILFPDALWRVDSGHDECKCKAKLDDG